MEKQQVTVDGRIVSMDLFCLSGTKAIMQGEILFRKER